MIAALRAVAAGLAVAAALFLAGVAPGHIVYGRPSLHLLVSDADVVARAVVIGSELRDVGGGERRPVVRAELVEVLKGEVAPGEVSFAQHGHGVATFEPGEETLLLLRLVDSVRELGALHGAGVVDYVSLQEHDAEFPLAESSRDALLGAVRAYVALEAVPDVEARSAALRRTTVDLLTSGDDRLATSALSDLVLAAGLSLVTEAELPRLLPLLEDADTPIGLRAGLVAELSRRALVEGPPAWVDLLEGADAESLPAAVRAAGAHPSPPVTARLVVLLSSEIDAVAESAAIALGHPGHAIAAARLARCLSSDSPRLRMAAIRALGHIGSPEAALALDLAAATHEDDATRRRARAEVARLGADAR